MKQKCFVIFCNICYILQRFSISDCNFQLRSAINFFWGGWNQIQSPVLDFADRRVNLRSAMHNYNEHETMKKSEKLSIRYRIRSELIFSKISGPVFSKSGNQNRFFDGHVLTSTFLQLETLKFV
jgi:hypothetical protein